jgi:hypothetical protein
MTAGQELHDEGFEFNRAPRLRTGESLWPCVAWRSITLGLRALVFDASRWSTSPCVKSFEGRGIQKRANPATKSTSA